MRVAPMLVTGPNELPLSPRDRVVVDVAQLPPLAATVARVAGTEATLVLDEGAVPARVLHKRPAALQIAVDGKHYRGDGVLAMVARGGRVRDDAIAFHFLSQKAPLRRVHTRAPAILPVTVVPIDAPLPPARALTVDISAGGALVKSPAALGAGEALLLHLHLPEEELPVPAKGAVVRQTADGLLGVRLDKMRPADRELVVHYILRQARRLGSA
jgi:PilZ domain